jgi:hypothetical protein
MEQKVHKLPIPTFALRSEQTKHGTSPLIASLRTAELCEGFAGVTDALERLENRCRKSTSEKRGRRIACSLSLAKLHLDQAAIDALSVSKLDGDVAPECPEWTLDVVTDLTVAMLGRGNHREAALLSQLALELSSRSSELSTHRPHQDTDSET